MRKQRTELIARRREIGLKARRLAEMLGISRYHVYKIEGGGRACPPALMAQWARLLRSDITVWPEEDRKRYFELLGALTEGLLPNAPEKRAA